MPSPSHAELLREYLEQLSEVDPETQVLGWRDWLRARVSGPVAITAALSLFACGGEDEDPVATGGTAGATQAQGGSVGSGGTSARSSSTAAIAGSGNVGILYAAPMGGASNIGALYAIAMGGRENTGGTSAAASGGSGEGGTSGAGVGGITGAKYAVPLGGTTASTFRAIGGNGLKYAAPSGGSMITRYAAPLTGNDE
ncbi:MAG: hypothetical protein QM784_23130 [Polyangiaceae bacterium]